MRLDLMISQKRVTSKDNVSQKKYGVVASNWYEIKTTIQNLFPNTYLRRLEKTFTPFQSNLLPGWHGAELVPVHPEDLGKLRVAEVLLLLGGVHVLGHLLPGEHGVGENTARAGVALHAEPIAHHLQSRGVNNICLKC